MPLRAYDAGLKDKERAKLPHSPLRLSAFTIITSEIKINCPGPKK